MDLNSEEKFLMEDDIIESGIYTGEKLEDLIEMEGKKIIIRVMWSNKVHPDVLKKYQIRPATEEETIAWDEKQRNQKGKNNSKVDFLTSILYGDFDDDNYPYGLRA